MIHPAIRIEKLSKATTSSIKMRAGAVIAPFERR